MSARGEGRGVAEREGYVWVKVAKEVKEAVEKVEKMEKMVEKKE